MDKVEVRYCERCGAQMKGEGSWGHDDNCPLMNELRERMIWAVLSKITNNNNLPIWMQIHSLGQDMRPLAETVVDAILAEKMEAD
jgi:NMD protein affecting ribosome stability and mRNA decay